MPPSPRSLLWPTMLMPRKWCLSAGGAVSGPQKFPRLNPPPASTHSPQGLTHVESDSDDVQGHGGVGDAAEGGGLWKDPVRGCVDTTQSRHPTHQLPTRSVCLKRCFRRRHLCLRISREEVLCSVELLSLRQGTRGRNKEPGVRKAQGTNIYKQPVLLTINLQHILTCAHATYRLVLSSSSESIKLLDSSSLLSTVDALSGGSPKSRRRSPLGCPLVRAAVGIVGWEDCGTSVVTE